MTAWRKSLGGRVELETITIVNPDETQFDELLPDLIRVYQSAYRDLPPYYSDHGLARVSDYLRWLYEGEPEGFFVALDRGVPVGFVSLHSEKHGWHGDLIGELQEVVTDPDCQGKGIGRELITRSLRYAADRGRDRVRLWVGERNSRAANLYRRLGFVTLSQHGMWERMELVLATNQ